MVKDPSDEGSVLSGEILATFAFSLSQLPGVSRKTFNRL